MEQHSCVAPNTGATATLIDITEESFRVCIAQLHFVSATAQSVTAQVQVPCVASNSTSIKVCYNWNNPHNVEYNIKERDNECSIGSTAFGWSVAAYIAIMALFAVLSGCTVKEVWHEARIKCQAKSE